MQGIQAILTDRLQKQVEKKSRLATQHQVIAFETAEMLGVSLKSKKELGILLRLAKVNPNIFNKARLYLYGLKKDGYGGKVNIGYFLAMYKIYNQEAKK